MVIDDSSETRIALHKLDRTEVEDALKNLPGWRFDQNWLVKTYSFSDFYAVMAFVNAVAWIAHQANHHPDLSVHYASCVVSYTTHDAGGLTTADIHCATEIEHLKSAGSSR